MLAIRNRTPYAAAIVPGLDREGYDTATLVVKGTFEIAAAGQPLHLADEQQPILHADEHHGEPGASSVRRESDACPRKPGADVVLVGYALSRRRVESLDVTLTAGPARKVVRVFGERRWFRAIGGWAISDPVPFERMPLVYERAFGGADTDDPDPARHAVERRNPVGTGLEIGREARDLEGLPLPNLEDPRELIYTPSDRPPPAGFGFIGRGWLPRASYAGTYDDAWRAERCPFLPDDFDERYFQGAHPDLVLSAPLRGGELITATNVSELGDLRLQVPAVGVAATARVRGAPVELSPRIDTLLLEPDERRLTLTWRATFRCPRSFLYIDDVLIREVAA